MNSITVFEFEQTAAVAQEAEQALQMDEENFCAFYDRTARPLLVYLTRVAGNRTLAEDLMQETYYRFLRARLPELGETHRKNYLFRIATNLMRDHWRRHKDQFKMEAETCEIGAPESMTERIHQQSVLRRAMQRLKPQEREMLLLAYGQGSDHKEIAEILGLKAASIRLLLFRARRRLAELLRRSDQPARRPTGATLKEKE